MSVFLIILGIVLCLQGASPILQELFNQDSKESLFLVNAVSDFQPFASIALIAVGVFLIIKGNSLHRRAKRNTQDRA